MNPKTMDVWYVHVQDYDLDVELGYFTREASAQKCVVDSKKTNIWAQNYPDKITITKIKVNLE